MTDSIPFVKKFTSTKNNTCIQSYCIQFYNPFTKVSANLYSLFEGYVDGISIRCCYFSAFTLSLYRLLSWVYTNFYSEYIPSFILSLYHLLSWVYINIYSEYISSQFEMSASPIWYVSFSYLILTIQYLLFAKF